VGTFRDEIGETTREGGAGDEPPPPAEVPGLSGLMLDEAEAELSRSGLESGARTETVSGTVSPGVVLGQDPSAGSEVEAGAAVDLVVSAPGGPEGGPGPPPETPVSEQYGV
jgi:serine/threonine-protein kinase